MPPDLKIELAQGWIAKARGDFVGAEILGASDRAAGWVVGFHCQQCVEKSMKARLVLANIKPPRTHLLREILELTDFAARAFPLELAELDALQTFAVADRYPILLPSGTSRGDVLRLVESARKAMAWIDAELAASTLG